MKYSDIMATLPRLLRSRDAADYVAGEAVLVDLSENHGLKPIIQKKGVTAYDRHDLDAAIERLKKSK